MFRVPGKAASGREADGRLTWAAWREHVQLARDEGGVADARPGTWYLWL